MENNYVFSLILFGYGIIFIIVGPIEYFFPPRSRDQKGYRTKNSLKSQEHWDFAQKYCAKMVTISAICLLGTSIIGSLIPFSDRDGFIASIVVLILLAIIIRQKTEKAIKHKFD